MKYAVAQVDKDRAREALIRLWRENLPIEGSCESRFHWIYEEAPATPLDPLLLVSRNAGGEAVVGTAGVGRRAFAVRGRKVWAGLLTDLAVDRDHRSFLPALALVRRAREAARAHVGFAYGLPNPKAEPVLARAGYRRLGNVRRFARVLRHGGYARRVVPWDAAARAAGLLADAGSFTCRIGKIAAAAARYELTFSRGPDERVDDVWNAAAHRYSVAAVRSAELLRWRLARHPCERQRFAWLRRRGASRPCAYAATAWNGDVLVVRDFFGAPEVLGPLFERLAIQGRAEGARSLSVRFLGDRRVVAALRSAGLRPRDCRHAVVVAAFGTCRQVFHESGYWYLTDADQDA